MWLLIFVAYGLLLWMGMYLLARDAQNVLLRAAGAVLAVVALALASRRSPINRRLAWAAVVLDALWVLSSVVLIFSNQIPLTVAGKWAVALVADVVALFAVLQYVGIRRMG